MRVVSVGSYDNTFNRNVLTARLLSQSPEIDHVAHVGTPLVGDRMQLWQQSRKSSALRAIPAAVRLFVQTLADSLRHRNSIYLVQYPGYLDVPIVRLASVLGSGTVVYDPFISLYDTIVDDRQLCDAASVTARIIRSIDVTALRLAHTVICDTPETGDFLSELAQSPREKFKTLFIGADEHTYFPPTDEDKEQARVEVLANLEVPATSSPFLVLYYGNYIPLHGVDRIVAAAAHVDSRVHFILVGDGQERKHIELLVDPLTAQNFSFLERQSPDSIRRLIWATDVSLGVFGSSSKADRVLPNKVMEGMACQQVVVTGVSSATEAHLGAVITTANRPEDIAATINSLAKAEDLDEIRRFARNEYVQKFSGQIRLRQLTDILRNLIRTDHDQRQGPRFY